MPGMSPVIWGSEKNQKRFAGQVEEWTRVESTSGVLSSFWTNKNGKKMLFLSERHGMFLSFVAFFLATSWCSSLR